MVRWANITLRSEKRHTCTHALARHIREGKETNRNVQQHHRKIEESRVRVGLFIDSLSSFMRLVTPCLSLVSKSSRVRLEVTGPEFYYFSSSWVRNFQGKCNSHTCALAHYIASFLTHWLTVTTTITSAINYKQRCRQCRFDDSAARDGDSALRARRPGIIRALRNRNQTGD